MSFGPLPIAFPFSAAFSAADFSSVRSPAFYLDEPDLNLAAQRATDRGRLPGPTSCLYAEHGRKVPETLTEADPPLGPQVSDRLISYFRLESGCPRCWVPTNRSSFVGWRCLALGHLGKHKSIRSRYQFHGPAKTRELANLRSSQPAKSLSPLALPLPVAARLVPLTPLALPTPPICREFPSPRAQSFHAEPRLHHCFESFDWSSYKPSHLSERLGVPPFFIFSRKNRLRIISGNSETGCFYRQIGTLGDPPVKFCPCLYSELLHHFW
jgi:hypothetical protein